MFTKHLGITRTDLFTTGSDGRAKLKESESKPLHEQIGGNHYKKLAIQPVEYVHANNLGYFEGTVIKYVSRWRDKNGIEDLKKARHFLDLLIDLETNNGTKQESNGEGTGVG